MPLFHKGDFNSKRDRKLMEGKKNEERKTTGLATGDAERKKKGRHKEKRKATRLEFLSVVR